MDLFYFLILFIVTGMPASPALTTVGPFTSESACVEAGKKAKAELHAYYVCVRK